MKIKLKNPNPNLLDGNLRDRVRVAVLWSEARRHIGHQHLRFFLLFLLNAPPVRRRRPPPPICGDEPAIPVPLLLGRVVRRLRQRNNGARRRGVEGVVAPAGGADHVAG